MCLHVKRCCGTEVPTADSPESFRKTPYLIENTNQNTMLQVLTTDMGDSITYNPVTKKNPKKPKPQPKSKRVPKRNAAFEAV